MNATEDENDELVGYADLVDSNPVRFELGGVFLDEHYSEAALEENERDLKTRMERLSSVGDGAHAGREPKRHSRPIPRLGKARGDLEKKFGDDSGESWVMADDEAEAILVVNWLFTCRALRGGDKPICEFHLLPWDIVLESEEPVAAGRGTIAPDSPSKMWYGMVRAAARTLRVKLGQPGEAGSGPGSSRRRKKRPGRHLEFDESEDEKVRSAWNHSTELTRAEFEQQAGMKPGALERLLARCRLRDRNRRL